MNFKHKYLVNTIRIILGLFLTMSGVTGFMAGSAMTGVPQPMVVASQSLWSMGIFQMIKTTEIIAGLMLVIGFLPALAALFIAPLCVGIIVFDSNIAPQFLPAGIIVTILTVYLGYAYWHKYSAIFSRA